MKRNSEINQVKKVANFKKLTTAVQSYGTVSKLNTIKNCIKKVTILTIVLIWFSINASASGPFNGDSYLKLDNTNTGYASRPDTQVDDLDYSKSFSVEALIKIESQRSYGAYAYIFGKGHGGDYTGATTGVFLDFRESHIAMYGQYIAGTVKDGVNTVEVKSNCIEGYAYSVMTWNVQSKILVLYINGQEVKRDTNTSIIPLNIKNIYPMVLGQKNGGTTLGANIFFVRLWNREVSATEVSALWNNYQNTGQHILPGSVPATDLKSQWLMDQTCNSSGGVGTTYIKDSYGANHLELLDGATIQRQTGTFQIVTPLSGATGIDKTVYLTVEGGEASLGSGVILPLHYSFEVDELSGFNSTALQTSGWQTHYSQWSPTLKPNTTYYWRAKVCDSKNTPTESNWTTVQSFQTEGTSVWFVRPKLPSALSLYGTGDGKSYENAFNGLEHSMGYYGQISNIPWGPGGVEAGDTLYICDTHQHFISEPYGGFLIKASGFSNEYPITILGDYTGHQGIIESETGLYLTIQRKRFLVFKNLTFNGFGLEPDGLNNVNGALPDLTDDPKSTDITFDGCTFDGGSIWLDCFFVPATGNDRWTFMNNTFMNGKNGVYTSTYGDLTGGGANFLTVKNNIFRNILGHQDSHAIGIQGGQGHLIEGNYIENTGAAINFWADTRPMHNMTIRNNFIKDVIHVVGGTGGFVEGIGITIAANYDGIQDTNTIRYWNIDHNIIINSAGGGIYLTTREDISLNISNNIIMNSGSLGYDCALATNYWGVGGTIEGKIYNNIIINPASSTFINVSGQLEIDNNLYFSSIGAKKWFNYTSFSAYQSATGFDTNGMVADPQFVSANPLLPVDFKLNCTSPAISTGYNWGQTTDYFGNLIQGLPDIGPIEWVSDSIAATTPGSRCGTGSVTLGATASSGVVTWWDAASGGTNLGTGTSYITPSISATTTYYVDATDNGCTTVPRIPVTATVNIIPTATTQSLTLCAGESLTVGTNTYTTTGIYTDILTAANNCDSVVTTDLTVENTIDVSTTLISETITANATGSIYQWIDCNNGFAVIIGETSQSYTATANGNYAVEITQGICSDTSLCVQITSVGIASIQKEGIAIYPNPMSNELIIEINGNTKNTDFEILNSIGQVVFKGNLIEKTVVQTSSFSPGIYLIKLENGKTFEFKKIVKE